MSFFSDLKNKISGKKDQNQYLDGFSKTNNSLGKKLRIITGGNAKNDEEFLEKLMVTLIEADIGYKTAEKITSAFNKESRDFVFLRQDDVIDILSEIFYKFYHKDDIEEIKYNNNGPTVILLVGVNGSGKTSSCAKLAKKYQDEGKKVCLVAGDTFRAGATEQLKKWAEKLGTAFVCGKDGQDPSSVLVDGCRYAKENDIDILLCDTAGRLQNKVNLMSELSKMHKVISREIEGAPHNVWLVLDANTGQNGISQAMLFDSATQLDGIILTKMDGTSKGGIVIAIRDLLDLPVRYITLGESVEAINEFDFDMYLYSVIGDLNNA